jgi:hypothetical protein
MGRFGVFGVGMAMTKPSLFCVLICSICGKRVNPETSKTDEVGKPVHEECYLEKIQREQQAFKNLFRAPVRVYPCK